MALRTVPASALGGTPSVSCQLNWTSSSRIWMASGELDREVSRPCGHGGACPAPVVDLAGGGAGEAGEFRLADAGAGQQGGEFGA
jgi:hypothetical protein